MAQAQEITQPSGIVTPEAVVLQFETANVGSRLVAAVIDALIQGTTVAVLLFAFGLLASSASLPGWTFVALFLVALFLVLFAYPAAFETVWRGRTPGKAALGLRVVTVEGAPVRFRHAAIRAALATIEIYAFGFVSVIMILLTGRNQRLGDLVAGTMVLRERSGAGDPRAVAFQTPYGMEPYVATLDTSGLTGPDYTAVRSFLVRAATLPPAVRFDLARNLATPLTARLRHRPPPSVGPEMFLACLAVAYQRRTAGPGGYQGGQAPAWNQPAGPPGASPMPSWPAPAPAVSPSWPTPAPAGAGYSAPGGAGYPSGVATGSSPATPTPAPADRPAPGTGLVHPPGPPPAFAPPA